METNNFMPTANEILQCYLKQLAIFFIDVFGFCSFVNFLTDEKY